MIDPGIQYQIFKWFKFPVCTLPFKDHWTPPTCTLSGFLSICPSPHYLWLLSPKSHLGLST